MTSPLPLRAPKSLTNFNVSFYIKRDKKNLDQTRDFVLGSGSSRNSILIRLNPEKGILTSPNYDITNAYIRGGNNGWHICSFDVKVEDANRLVLVKLFSPTETDEAVTRVQLEESAPSLVFSPAIVEKSEKSERKPRPPAYYEKFNSRNFRKR